MTNANLAETARAMVAPGKGILAADESTPTIGKRFAGIGVESTEPLRRDYRSMLFSAPSADQYISGVILFDETLRQAMPDGESIPQYLAGRGMIPGIKVDKGAKPLAGCPGEKVTEGLDGLRERLAEYRGLGARFAKWRAVIAIGEGAPSDCCVHANAHALARYAALCQEGGLVPIVEPEVLMDGPHPISRCEQVTGAVLDQVFDELERHRVELEGIVLKPNMVVSGNECAAQAGARGRGGGGHLADAEGARAGSGAGHRFPVRRAVGGRSDRPPERHECAGAAPLAGFVFLRPRAAGPGAGCLAGQGGPAGRCAAGVRRARPAQRPGAHRRLPPGTGSSLAGARWERGTCPRSRVRPS